MLSNRSPNEAPAIAVHFYAVGQVESLKGNIAIYCLSLGSSNLESISRILAYSERVSFPLECPVKP